jgi:hypothetical protein
MDRGWEWEARVAGTERRTHCAARWRCGKWHRRGRRNDEHEQRTNEQRKRLDICAARRRRAALLDLCAVRLRRGADNTSILRPVAHAHAHTRSPRPPPSTHTAAPGGSARGACAVAMVLIHLKVRACVPRSHTLHDCACACAAAASPARRRRAEPRAVRRLPAAAHGGAPVPVRGARGDAGGGVDRVARHALQRAPAPGSPLRRGRGAGHLRPRAAARPAGACCGSGSSRQRANASR